MECQEYPGFLVFSTDGSSLGNGKKKAVAGTGVYFGPNDPRNYGEALGPGRQTNQRAELNGLLQGFTIIPIDQNALCESDSAYALMCVTVWCFRWEFKSWKKPQGIKFENLDLIVPILKLLEQRRRHGAQTLFRWVKDHAGNPGNEAADKLAVQGAKYAFTVVGRFRTGSTLAYMSRREYERRYGQLPGKERRSVFRYAPFGWKEVRHADGSETLERISQKTMDRIVDEGKSRAAARKARAEKYKNKRDRGANMAGRLALREARKEAAAAPSHSTLG